MSQVKGLALQSFRGYSAKTLLFPQKYTALVGHNAAGKTSILEALFLLSVGESFRAEDTNEMIRVGAEYARVKGEVNVEDEDVTLEVLLTNGIVNGRRTQRRLYSVNNVRRQKRMFLGQFPAIIFRPEDLRLIEGSPSRRRQFLDTVLTITDKHYALALHTYEDALKRRNRLLSLVQEGTQPRSVLTYWTQTILKHGQTVQTARAEWLYKSTQVDFPLPFTVEYVPSVISEERLAKYAENEIAAGHTLIGPHKDDFTVKLPLAMKPDEPLPVAAYGSRGQQRLAVLWLKLAEYTYLENTLSQIPVLLLDDILSELDDEHRQFVFTLLGKGQVIMTTADSAVIPELRSRFPDMDVQELAMETS